MLAAATLGASSAAEAQCCKKPVGPLKLKGNINHSICHWCFTADCSCAPISLEALCAHAKKIGVKSVELVAEKDYPILKKYGLIDAMCNSHGFVRGFNDKKNHEWAIDIVRHSIDVAAEYNFPNVICFPGFRNDIPDDVGMENMVAGIKKIVGYAEKKGITLCVEILNSRVDESMKGHPGYMGDTTEWCGEMCKQVGSPAMKMLFDIYHVQIMQGDVIRRIKKWHEYIGHYHTAGNPGRNELDDNQELNYPAIMKVIAETGYDMYVGHEFIPTRAPLEGLHQAITLCDV